MTLDSRVVIPFRERVAKRYRIWCYASIVLAAIATACLLCEWITIPFLQFLLAALIAFGLFLAIDLWLHHARLLRILNGNDPAWSKSFDVYITNKLARWEKEITKRILIGTSLALVTLFLLFYKGNEQWLAIAASLLIAFVLFSMLKSWHYFLDGILLHDVRRTTRAQAPDMSMW